VRRQEESAARKREIGEQIARSGENRNRKTRRDRGQEAGSQRVATDRERRCPERSTRSVTSPADEGRATGSGAASPRAVTESHKIWSRLQMRDTVRPYGGELPNRSAKSPARSERRGAAAQVVAVREAAGGPTAPCRAAASSCACKKSIRRGATVARATHAASGYRTSRGSWTTAIAGKSVTAASSIRSSDQVGSRAAARTCASRRAARRTERIMLVEPEADTRTIARPAKRSRGWRSEGLDSRPRGSRIHAAADEQPSPSRQHRLRVREGSRRSRRHVSQTSKRLTLSFPPPKGGGGRTEIEEGRRGGSGMRRRRRNPPEKKGR